MENKKRLIEIPEDGIVRIHLMRGEDTVGERRIDLSFLPTVDAAEVVKGLWIPGNKPPKEWKDEKGEAINFLAVIPGMGIDIANWIEPTRCWFCMGVPCKVTYWMPLPEPPQEE